MQVEKIELDRGKARELWRAYKTHQHYEEPIDEEIRRAYQLIAQGRLVIRAAESIRAAGMGPDGRPKLAIVRADAKECFLRTTRERLTFSMTDSWSRRENEHHSRRVTVPWPALPATAPHGRAIPPLIPIHLRPKRGLANYHILWEAEWQPVPPRDPYLLRKIGRGDMWLVVAAWDLTEVERAALATRLSS